MADEAVSANRKLLHTLQKQHKIALFSQKKKKRKGYFKTLIRLKFEMAQMF